MRVSLIQMPAEGSAGSPDPAHFVRGWVKAADGSDLIVLPEMWHPGYFAFDGYARAAEDTPALWAALSETAAAVGACLHAGSLVEADSGRLYNTSVLFRTRWHRTRPVPQDAPVRFRQPGTADVEPRRRDSGRRHASGALGDGGLL